MNERKQRLEAVFHAAMDLDSPRARDRYLAEACVGDPELRREVDELLKSAKVADAVFQAGREACRGPELLPASVLTEKPGDRIGRYKLLEKIGEGGMGVVYMAEQEEPVRRRVALKIIKLGMDTKQVIARFEAERQALAMMDHPHIAKIFDAGVTGQRSEVGGQRSEKGTAGSLTSVLCHPASGSGRPYFVMELVQGVPITEFCEKNQFSTEQRIKLFIPVCQAIQSAHQKGIIHRDIKPSNVLVTLNAGVPHPMVIDFGVAKATNQKLTEKTLFTNFATMIGTPAYMSPEQAEMSRLDVDTRSDIYSLGVLLYELLTGTTPFPEKRLRSVAYREMQRIIVEEEPERPSKVVERLSKLRVESGGEHVKQTLNSQLKLLSTDLDWIVMKCLEKDRARRYETANGVAMDIQRHLNCEPVIARPPSRLYEFQKIVRRHKFGFAAGAAVITVLAAGVLVSTWQAFRATRAEREQTRFRQIAETEKQTSEQVSQFLKDMLKGVEPSVALGRDTKMLKEILDKTAERVGKDLKNQPEVEVELRGILAQTYLELGLFKQGEEMAREALRVGRSQLSEEHLAVAEALQQLGDASRRLGHKGEAEKFSREALAMKRKLLGNEHPIVAASLNDLGFVLKRLDRLAEAELVAREALALRRKLYGNEHSSVAASLYLLAIVVDGQYRFSEAESLHREALAIQRKVLGEEHPEVTYTLNSLAFVLRRQGKLTEAEVLLRKSLEMEKKLYGAEHPEVAASLRDLALVLGHQGKLAEAEAMNREALAMQRKLLGEEHPGEAAILENLALVLHRQGRLAEAEAAYREMARRGRIGGVVALAWFLATCDDPKFRDGPRALGLAENVGTVSERQRPGYLDALAAAYAETGQFAQAIRAEQEAIALSLDEEAQNDFAYRLKLYESNSAYRERASDVLTGYGDFAARESLRRHQLEDLRTRLPAGDPQLATTLAALTSTLLVREKFIEAEPLARECLAIREQKMPDDWRTFASRSLLGGSLLGQKKYAEAEPLLLSGYEGMTQREARIPASGKPRLRESLERLVQLYDETARPAQAAEWKQKLAEFQNPKK